MSLQKYAVQTEVTRQAWPIGSKGINITKMAMNSNPDHDKEPSLDPSFLTSSLLFPVTMVYLWPKNELQLHSPYPVQRRPGKVFVAATRTHCHYEPLAHRGRWVSRHGTRFGSWRPARGTVIRCSAPWSQWWYGRGRCRLKAEDVCEFWRVTERLMNRGVC